MGEGTAEGDQAPIGLVDPSMTEEDIAAIVGVLRSGWPTSVHESVALEE